MVKIKPNLQMSNNLVKLSTKGDTTGQLCFGAMLFYRYKAFTKKFQKEKKNKSDYDQCFPKNKSRTLKEIRYLGVGFYKSQF